MSANEKSKSVDVVMLYPTLTGPAGEKRSVDADVAKSLIERNLAREA